MLPSPTSATVDLFLSPSTSVASFSNRLDLISGGETSQAQIRLFDGVEPGAAALVIMGLDGGIGFGPAEPAPVQRVAAVISERSPLTCDVGID